MDIHIPNIILYLITAMGFIILIMGTILSFTRIAHDWKDYTKKDSIGVRMLAFILNLIMLIAFFILLIKAK